MRISRALAAMTATLLLAAVGCSHQIEGTAKPDPTQPPLALSEDGSGIVAGYPDAPVQFELYTEPQCNHCAALQKEFGDDIERYINLGLLAVTYRPLTFLDQLANEDYSARVANALFLSVGAPKATDAPSAASGPEFQRFVEELWAAQDPDRKRAHRRGHEGHGQEGRYAERRRGQDRRGRDRLRMSTSTRWPPPTTSRSSLSIR